MKISNEKTLIHFANSKPVDKEGYLLKRGEINKAFQKRYFVLKGNLLFYFDKKGGEILGMIVLEGCVIELAEYETENFSFFIDFIGNRKYVLASDNQQDMESWMRALTCSGFDYMKIMVSEMQRQLDEFDKSCNINPTEPSPSSSRDEIPKVPPRRQNPFNKFNNTYNNNEAKIQQVAEQPTKPERRPPPPVPTMDANILNNQNNFRDSVQFTNIRDDNEFMMDLKTEKKDEGNFGFLSLHRMLGRPIEVEVEARKAVKSQQEQPLIVL